MSTVEIVLAILQSVVIPLVGWMCLQIISNIRSIAAMEARMDIYFGQMSLKAVKSLHSPHSPEFDSLLDKWLGTINGGKNMTEQELRKFIHKLELVEDEKDDYFRSQAAGMLRAIVLAKYPNLIKQSHHENNPPQSGGPSGSPISSGI